MFPSAESLAGAKLGDLRKLGLGYRAQYVKSLGESVAENGFASELKKIESMNYGDAVEKIMELEGVGPKVADCALLFAYGFGQVFPVDTWLRQIMLKHYPSAIRNHLKKRGSRARAPAEKHIAEFAREKFGEKAGVVHEFLFAAREKLV